MLEIALLGHFEVQSDGEPIDLPSRIQQKLLAYLVLHAGQTLPRTKVAGLLWPESPEATARKNLRHHLWRLRQTLGEECLQTSRATVALEATALCHLDVKVLARDAVDGDVGALAEAVSAYKGELLPGFYDDWVQLERERLQALFERQMEGLLKRLAAEARWSDLVRWSEQWIARGQIPEPAYRFLMTGYAGLGDLAAVARTYQRCQKALVEELGVEPAPQTRALYDSLRAGHSPAVQTIPPPGNNLPVHLTPFVGRQGEVADLQGLLADARVRLVTITGPGGMGKTSLALEVARTLVERFADGAAFAGLAAVSGPNAVVPALAQALCLPLQAGDRREAEGQLLSYLRGKELLLVLDNFEHLREAAPLLTRVAQAAPQVKLLVTSRERLKLRAEHVFPLGGFAGDGWAEMSEARSDPFVQLFLHSARRVRRDYSLAPDALEPLARLREITGGLPLAVILAGSWADVLPLTEIVANIGQDVDFLRSDLGNIPRRQRSMRAVFEGTWRRLDVVERSALARLCLFRGGFTRSAAREVAGTSLRTLATLSAKSLLQYDAGRDRYEIHELLRRFGEAMLRRQPHLEQETRQCHAAFYCRFLQEKGQALSGERPDEALLELEQDMSNVHLAWKWAGANGQIALLNQGLLGLVLYYSSRGNEGEARDLLKGTTESLLSQPEGPVEEEIDRRRLLVRLLTWQDPFRLSMAEGRAALEQAEAILDGLRRQEVDVRREEAEWADRRGLSEMGVDPAASCPYLERARSLWRDLGEPASEAYAVSRLGFVAWQLGNFGQAADLASRALDAHKALGDQDGIGGDLNVLALVEKHRGRLAAARQAHREGYTLYREMGDLVGAAVLGAELVSTLCWSGEYAEAHTIALEGLQQAREVGSPWLTSLVADSAARACLHLGRYDDARQQAQRAITLARSTGEGGRLGRALTPLGQWKLVSGSYEEAVARLEEAGTRLAEYRKPLWMLPLVYQAYALRKLDRSPLARRVLAEAMRENMEPQVFFVAVNALPPAALLLADQGEVELALGLYSLACSYPHVGNSRWFEEMMGEEVEAWAAALPREVVEAARERGRARDLWETAEELVARFGGG